MGRKQKLEHEKKVKIGISLDRELYNKIMVNGGKRSRIIEKIIREYCENKGLV